MFNIFNRAPKGSKVVFLLDGMHCTSCSLNIDFALEDLKGVLEARTNYATQRSAVTFDPSRVSLKQMISVIEKLGYAATILEGKNA